YGLALALYHRQRTGEGQHVATALARTACTLQSLFLQDYPGKRWDDPRGQSALGEDACNRLYRASDRWVYFACRLDEYGRVAAAARAPQSAAAAARARARAE